MYMGSKGRIAKYIVPIIQSYIDSTAATLYIEPFVGGANVIDKVQCEQRCGYDIEPYLIACLQKLERGGWLPPTQLSKAEYLHIRDHKDEYPDYLVGYVGYQNSYGGKFFAGYQSDGVGKRNYIQEGYNRTMRQIPNLKGIKFAVSDYRQLEIPKGAVIYCDPPYLNTTGYQSARHFDHEQFYDWCRQAAQHNTVLVSECYMPDFATELWQKPLATSFDCNAVTALRRMEKLYIIN